MIVTMTGHVRLVDRITTHPEALFVTKFETWTGSPRVTHTGSLSSDKHRFVGDQCSGASVLDEHLIVVRGQSYFQ